MLKRVYVVLSAFFIGAYLFSFWSGWELQSARKQMLPAGVRQSPGGWRSFHFWHTGYRGGK